MAALPYPSAPPGNMFDPIPGYEGTVAGGGGGYLPPPMPSVPMPVPEQAPTSDWHIPSISEERAREAFATYVSSKCCYSSGPVQDGVVTNMESFNTYRYRLETFTESRSTEWSQEPYTGQPVDAGIQLAPGPWDIPAQQPAFFQDQKKSIRVPFTSSVKVWLLNTLGNVTQLTVTLVLEWGKNPARPAQELETISVNGFFTIVVYEQKVCWVCNGSGHRQSDDRCTHCNGVGRENCSSCSGNGSINCDECHGKRQLFVFINLNVKWSTEREDFVAQDSSGLKVEKLGNVSGKELFKDSHYMVYPVMGFPDVLVAQASERMVRDHQAKFAQSARILQQRQIIELIPITKVNYAWKGKNYMYYVYGNEFEVNADDYPATCCCSVM
ncbi:hypothetical protein DNTS_024625 [Danionella cerebrum]|uniref:Protein SSUH2 homolog n=1 Tax=Danionella cerebrum TaxID=2873325 RepID=A0A553NHS1_9TELE|nr:hypothetical protein DNTS_024625 [Danionella translucida]TRY64939.1 hypothetical protein DNTS_024625 [Danionella translucida]